MTSVWFLTFVVITLYFTLCVTQETWIKASSMMNNDKRLVVSTTAGSLIILNGRDGSFLLKIKGRSTAEGYNNVPDQLDLFLGVSSGSIQVVDLENDKNSPNQKGMETSIEHMMSQNWNHSDSTVSLTYQKDTIHHIDLDSSEINSIVLSEGVKEKSNNLAIVPVIGDNHNLPLKMKPTYRPRIDNENLTRTLSSTTTRLTLIQKSYSVSAYDVNEQKVLWHIDYSVFPQVEKAHFLDDESLYMASIHSNKLISLNVTTGNINWLIQLDAHLKSLGILSIDGEACRIHQLRVKFVSEETLQGIISQVGIASTKLMALTSREDFEDRVVLTELKGVKLYFDNYHPNSVSWHGAQRKGNCYSNDPCCAPSNYDHRFCPLPSNTSILPVSYTPTKIVHYSGGAFWSKCRPFSCFSPSPSNYATNSGHRQLGLCLVNQFTACSEELMNRYTINMAFVFVTIFLLSVSFVYILLGFRLKFRRPNQSASTVCDPTSHIDDDHIKLADITLKIGERLDQKDENSCSSCFRGTFGGNACVFRRYTIRGIGGDTVRQLDKETITCDCPIKFQKETEALKILEKSGYVVQQLWKQTNSQFYFLAMEQCDFNLHQYFHNETTEPMVDFNIKLNMLEQIFKGMRVMHKNNICHGNLKPENILIMKNQHSNFGSGQFRVLISDFKHSVFLTEQLNASNSSTGALKRNYFEEELVRLSDVELAKANDIRLLGMLSVFVLSDGNYPYLTDFKIYSKHLTEFCFSHRYHLFDWRGGHEAADLVRHSIHLDPTKRPTACELIYHPIFWSIEKKGNFISEISNKIESMANNHYCIRELERCSVRVIRGSWLNLIRRVIYDDAMRHRKYNGSSCKDLLRVIRNKRNHFHDSTMQLTDAFKTSDELTQFFLDQFPGLIVTVYNVMKKQPWVKEPTFQPFFGAK